MSWGVLAPLLMVGRAQAAERIYVSFGALERSISVNALETYAKTGEIEDDLAVYAQYADPQALEELREVLIAPIPLSAVAISQFLYTSQGETLLERLSQVIQTETRYPGFFALRSALILAADRPDGLTLLNFLQQFPTEGIRIDLASSLDIARELEALVDDTNKATAAIVKQARLEATSPVPPVVRPRNLRRRGEFGVNKQSLTLQDLTRQTGQLDGTGNPVRRERTIEVDLYIPQAGAQATTLYPAPVVVISHGLGSDRMTFAYLADYLASYGFVVAVPEHPGSNAGQIQALLSGRATEVAEPAEFIDRPLDIKFLLDRLERRSQSEPGLRGRLDLNNVGIVGQSFGGYTALALAGAPLNFDLIEPTCPDNSSYNVSLLLQCRAEDITRRQMELSDPRIKAAIAINPVDSIVFGEAGLSQIQTPLMMITSNADTVAPALAEQIRPFTWLTTPNKYLALIENATHFSALDDGDNTETVPLPSPVIGAEPTLAQTYVKALSVAFFKTHLTNQSDFRPYLTANYAASLSRNPLPLSLVQSFTAEQLAQALSGEAPEPVTEPELDNESLSPLEPIVVPVEPIAPLDPAETNF